MFTSLTVMVHHVRPSKCVSNAIKDRLHTDDSAKLTAFASHLPQLTCSQYLGASDHLPVNQRVPQ